MKLLIFVFLLTICSCANTHQSSKPHNYTFDSYIAEFISESNGKFTEETMQDYVSIEFHTYLEDSTVVGTCHRNLIEKSIIWINEEWWNSLYVSEYQRLEVVFHELGHCVLLRAHTIPPNDSDRGFFTWWERLFFKIGIFIPKGYLKDGCPSSIMHPYTMLDLCFIKHYKYYMDELFRRK